MCASQQDFRTKPRGEHMPFTSMGFLGGKGPPSVHAPILTVSGLSLAASHANSHLQVSWDSSSNVYWRTALRFCYPLHQIRLCTQHHQANQYSTASGKSVFWISSSRAPRSGCFLSKRHTQSLEWKTSCPPFTTLLLLGSHLFRTCSLAITASSSSPNPFLLVALLFGAHEHGHKSIACFASSLHPSWSYVGVLIQWACIVKSWSAAIVVAPSASSPSLILAS